MAREPQNRRAALIAEASDWLARLDTGSAEPARFEAWRDADPAHAAAFAEVAATWGELDQLRDGPAPRKAAPAPNWSRRNFLRAAGVVGTAAVGGGLWATMQQPAYAETGVGERRMLRLDDGTALELNTDTRVSWRFNGRERRLTLERGEAAVTVAPDARPFRLDAGATRAALEPGEYNARRRGQGVDILVSRGRLAAGATVVRPGQAVLATASAAAVRASSPSESRSVDAWRHGEIIFEGQPLAAAVEEYNRYLDRKIVIADANVGALRMGGRFTTTDAGPFLAALHDTFGVRATDAGGGTIVLTAKN
jgi:transmembrane sensor